MKIIASYSNKGGVGKTANSVNLAYALAQDGYRTLLCDLDPQGASSFYFRVKPSRKLKEQDFFKDVDRFLAAIRASDFENLDLLPANMTFRDFDIFLSRMRNSRSRLKQALQNVKSDYDVVILDCTPNLSLLSESIFKCADHIIVPVIPTTLSERTFEQLLSFFQEHHYKPSKLLPFFSMVQKQKNLHVDTINRLNKQHKSFLKTQIPFATDIEKMGIHRAPVGSYAGSKPASKAYRELWKEISKKVKL